MNSRITVEDLDAYVGFNNEYEDTVRNDGKVMTYRKSTDLAGLEPGDVVGLGNYIDAELPPDMDPVWSVAAVKYADALPIHGIVAMDPGGHETYRSVDDFRVAMAEYYGKDALLWSPDREVGVLCWDKITEADYERAGYSVTDDA